MQFSFFKYLPMLPVILALPRPHREIPLESFDPLCQALHKEFLAGKRAFFFASEMLFALSWPGRQRSYKMLSMNTLSRSGSIHQKQHPKGSHLLSPPTPIPQDNLQLFSTGGRANPQQESALSNSTHNGSLK